MFKLCVVYDRDTGIVDKAFPNVDGSVLLNVAEGQDYIEWTPGVIAKLPDYSWVEQNADNELVLMRPPEKPSPHHTWDWPTKAWLPDLPTAREATRQAWNQWRDQELVKGFAHNGHVFHSDDRFIGELQLILKGYERGYLPSTSTSSIRTVDNGTVHLTHAEVETLLLLLGLHRQAIYQQSWEGKDALASKSTLEEIVAAGQPV